MSNVLKIKCAGKKWIWIVIDCTVWKLLKFTLTRLFDENFVKVTYLAKKIQKSWFHEFFSGDCEVLIFPQCKLTILYSDPNLNNPFLSSDFFRKFWPYKLVKIVILALQKCEKLGICAIIDVRNWPRLNLAFLKLAKTMILTIWK